MEDQEVQQNNMISNLPLLFANGYPTSLDKITESQLEGFIPFMVQCSLGHINLKDKIEYSEPEWWPENIPFTTPFSKPREFVGNWIDKMKEIVIICYQFHKSVFLLRFCNDLAEYEHASLRFINNYNSTTSLFDRRSSKLLVTFRNENMSYDQLQRNRKCLLQQKIKNGQGDDNENHMMVEPAPFDIYLCDNCDAELYSKEAILEHEKICSFDVNDVILCDTPEPTDGNHSLDFLKNDEFNELRIGFLLNFNLKFRENARNSILIQASGKIQERSLDFRAGMSPRDEKNYVILDNAKRVPRRNRTVHSIARCPIIPLSSPAGQLLVRTTKTSITEEYLNERLDRIERFCHAPIITSSFKPKYLDKKYTPNNVHCTFKKPSLEYSTHIYVFPRRQFSQKRRTENFMFFNSPLIKKCRPISVRLKKISEKEIKRKRSKKLNIKLTRDTSRSSNWKISSSPSTEIIVDTIDLCSSDDDFDITGEQFTEPRVSPFAHNYYTKKSVNTKTPLSSCGKNIDKYMLKNIRNRLNTSELNLTPNFKHVSNCPIKSENKSTPSFSIDSHNATSQRIPDNRKNKLFESNIRFSSPTLTIESGLTQPKPLQPSVFIFRNYATNPISVISGDNETVSDLRNTDLLETDICKSQNQENNLKKTAFSSNTKRSSGAALNLNTHSVEWLPHDNNFPSFNNHRINGDSNITHSRVIDCENPARNLSLMQSLGSPPRVTSIDLTS